MSTSIRWEFPTELTPDEQRVVQLLHRVGKFYVFSRRTDAEAVVTARVDQRWQLVLGGLARRRRRSRKALWSRFGSG